MNRSNVCKMWYRLPAHIHKHNLSCDDERDVEYPRAHRGVAKNGWSRYSLRPGLAGHHLQGEMVGGEAHVRKDKDDGEFCTLQRPAHPHKAQAGNHTPGRASTSHERNNRSTRSQR
eukprot:5614850-Prymnesium_polylepis.2